MKYFFLALMIGTLALVPYVQITMQRQARDAAEDRALNESIEQGRHELAQLQHHDCHHIRLSQNHATCLDQPKTQSWDQENLKRHDSGCPTAIFVAPHGTLVQCQATIDPDAPPPSPELLALIQLLTPRSTSEWRRFDTLHAAAIYAAMRLENCSHYYECSGFITVDPKDNKFVVSPVRTDYHSDSVRVDDETNPSDWKVVADFHSHPCVPHHYTGLFSGEDMIGAMMTRTTAYMVDLCTGDVHEFIPGVTKVDDVPIGEGGEFLSAGKIIGHVAAYPNDPVAHEGL